MTSSAHPGAVPQGFSTAIKIGQTPADNDKAELWKLFEKVAKARETYRADVERREMAQRELRNLQSREQAAARRLRREFDNLSRHVGAPQLPEDLAAE